MPLTILKTRLKTRSRLWLLLVACALVLAGWFSQRDSTPTPDGQWVPVQSQPEQRSVQADGYLQALNVVQITAPFDGKIVKRHVQIGDKVAQGTVLLEIDRSDVLAEHREAEIAHTRAAEALDELKNWKVSSPEVLNQKRQLQRSESSLDNARSKLQETQQLYDKGIIPRSELDSAQMEWANAQAEQQAAQEAMQAALKKGSSSQVRIAQLEYQNRASKLAQITQRLERATIVAPAEGVVLYPMADPAAQQPKEFAVGSFVSSKEVILSLGDVSQLKVSTALDEVDVANVAIGMPVQITLGSNPDLVLQGELTHISAQAKRDSMQGSGVAAAPMFEIQVLLREVPAALQPRVKLGMTAHLLIEPRSQALALTIPLAAVVREGAASYVLVRDGKKTSRRDVQLGKTLLDQVVVRSGLSAQDTVWLPRTATGTTDAAGLNLPGVASDHE